MPGIASRIRIAQALWSTRQPVNCREDVDLAAPKVIDHDDALNLLGGTTSDPHRIRQVNDVVSFVEPEDIEKGDHCLLCAFDFGTTTKDGFKEPSVKIRQCGHVFRAACLTTWLKDQKCCLMCRADIKSFHYQRGDELKVLDIAPEDSPEVEEKVAGTPSWMKLLLNDEEQADHEYLFCGLSKDKMKEYFNLRYRPIQGVIATLMRGGVQVQRQVQLLQPIAESSRRFVCECERDLPWLSPG
ncbi:hypothetical protein DL98DRAFT_532613 [Cadophora sp. DSE1049]|nr:hypothetical protein DL98DRAFT_532613 [Cadophora sp. DSE1049]